MEFASRLRGLSEELPRICSPITVCRGVGENSKVTTVTDTGWAKRSKYRPDARDLVVER